MLERISKDQAGKKEMLTGSRKTGHRLGGKLQPVRGCFLAVPC